MGMCPAWGQRLHSQRPPPNPPVAEGRGGRRGGWTWSFWEADPGLAHGTRCLEEVGPSKPARWVVLFPLYT